MPGHPGYGIVPDMQRLTISIDDDLAEALDALMASRGYENRSEAFRDLIRRELGMGQLQSRPDVACVATLTYVYDHHERTTANRIMDMQHGHHELTVSTMHAHLSHDLCVETTILRGPGDRVQAFAQSVLAQRGVRHGYLHVVPVASLADGGGVHGHAPAPRG
ncbi:MAG: nickel-responsive transcriptional regulator NikR [Burkholderiaceae bacterium]